MNLIIVYPATDSFICTHNLQVIGTASFFYFSIVDVHDNSDFLSVSLKIIYSCYFISEVVVNPVDFPVEYSATASLH